MPTKDEEAMALAQKHYELEAGLTQNFRITGTAELELRPVEPIKLLEVNENTVPSGIMPIQFGPSPASGLYYPSIILEVTPDEFQRIQNQESKLPTDRCAKQVTLVGSSNRPGQRMIGPNEASAAGDRLRGGILGTTPPGLGTPSCASPRP